jgi:ATP-dependent DNA helicase RecG
VASTRRCACFGPRESKRLKALALNGDGFRLAEIDLELRGEGELTGTRQSGMARFRFARLPDDGAVLEAAFACAEDLLRADPELEQPQHELLRAELARAEAAPVSA